jgi:ABC-type antimicrobial peptide transport system permease subunit
VTQSVPPGLVVAIKTVGDQAAVVRSVRAALRTIDPAMPLSNVRTMTEYTERSLMSRRAAMLLAASFAVVSLFLTVIGIYGVLAYLVTQRAREIGIRVVLGSTPRGILQLVLREGVLLVASGLLLGLVGTAALRRVLESQIYGLGVMDPVVLVLVTLIFGLIALAACSLPARRAVQVDPVGVLNR